MVKQALLSAFLALSMAAFARGVNNAIPPGTTLHCRLTQTLSTKMNHKGDAFSATITEPLMVNGSEVIPVGSTLEGRIAWLDRPGRFRGVGEMRLSPEKITFPDGRSFPISAVLLTAYGAEGAKVGGTEGTVKGPSSRLRQLEEVGIGMGGGGFVGTLIGGFHGAVVGGAVGGVAGLVDSVRRGGKDLTLPAGTELGYQLTSALSIQR